MNIIYEYGTFKKDVYELYNNILSEDFEPDVIYGVVRGGLVPATYISHLFKKPLKTITIQHIDFTMIGNLDNLIDDISSNKKILLVEDIIDSGKTISIIYEKTKPIINMFNPDNIKFASLWKNSNFNDQPFVHHINLIDRNIDKRWIIFPWEHIDE